MIPAMHPVTEAPTRDKELKITTVSNLNTHETKIIYLARIKIF